MGYCLKALTPNPLVLTAKSCSQAVLRLCTVRADPNSKGGRGIEPQTTQIVFPPGLKYLRAGRVGGYRLSPLP